MSYMESNLRQHHAYLLLGNIEHSRSFLYALLGEEKTSNDFIADYGLLGVDEAAEIRLQQQEKVEKKNIIISAERMSDNAQNALLKVIEEPNPGVMLYFLFPRQIPILPTIISRTITVVTPNNYQQLIFPVKDFLKSSHVQRLDQIDILDKNRKANKQDVVQSYEVQEFLDALESGLGMLFHKKPSLQLQESFHAIRQARAWAGQVGIPQKYILEYIAVYLITL